MKAIGRLQAKWKVGNVQFWLIIVTFALGGSLSGRLCSKILNFLFLEKNVAFWLVYPLVLTILWPFSVILVSFLTGQFSFFKGYLTRIASRFMGQKMSTLHLAIFASGAGSNTQKIIDYFDKKEIQGDTGVIKRVQVSLIVCNVPGAGVLKIAKQMGIPSLLIDKEDFNKNGYLQSLQNSGIDFIVLAGFLWKVPPVLVHAYPNSILNIHPALLPKYGGKGMYGAKVHEAVIAAGESESGITIHWVNEHYDQGAVVFQATCSVEVGDTPEILAAKIHTLEHAYFAPTIEQLISK